MGQLVRADQGFRRQRFPYLDWAAWAALAELLGFEWLGLGDSRSGTLTIASRYRSGCNISVLNERAWMVAECSLPGLHAQ